MSRLYVLNCTAQIRQVYYRLDFAIDGQGNRMDGKTMTPKYMDIAPGAQVLFGGELLPTQAQEIIQQLEETAGAVAVDQIRTAKAKGVVKLIWSIDKPVPRPVCEDVKAHNMGFLTEMGAERRRQMALASDANLRDQLAEHDIVNNDPIKFEMAIESVGQEDSEMTAPRLAEGLRVNQNGPTPNKPPRGRRAA